jgi:hypothetical protein
MSKEGAVIEVTSAQVCCPSVLDAPLDATEAAELAKAFAALADWVRLRVLSILAAARPVRHACATSSNRSARRSRVWLGHASAELTLDLSGRHLGTDADRSGIARMNAVLGDATGTRPATGSGETRTLGPKKAL